ncbi:MAG: hypothetical protein CMF49_04495 [Legionellales bacterium]|nr:hypothetical protein [Legionellales bacterium]|tara:strand:+ start:130 stop:1800 length:1671 start_codon:yes stop_codon:yes gene_type:complete
MGSNFNQVKQSIVFDLTFIFIAAITLYLGLILFLPFQSQLETSAMLILQNMLRTQNWLIPSLNGAKLVSQPPFYYTITGLWSKWFGLDFISLRLFSMFFALANLSLNYALMRYIFNRTAAILSTVILASSFIFTKFAVLVSPMQFNLFLFSSVLYAFVILLYCEAKNIKFFNVIFWLALSLLTLTASIYLSLMFLFALIIFSCILTDVYYLKRLHTIRGYLIFTAIILAWMTYFYVHVPHFFKFYFFDFPSYILLNLLNNNHFFNWSIILSLLIGFMPWTIFIVSTIWYNSPKNWADRKKETLNILLFTYSILFTLALMILKINNAWLILLLPALSLMTANFLTPSVYLKRLPLKSQTTEILIFCLIIITAFMLSQSLNNLTFKTFQTIIHNKYYQYLIAYISIIALTTCLALRYLRVKAMIGMIILLTIVTYVLGCTIYKFYPRPNDNLPIAQYLSTKIKTNDIIAAYHQYPADIAQKLNKNIVIISWRNQPFYSKHYQTNNQWLTTEPAFWQIIEQNHKKVYLLVPITLFEQINFKKYHLKLITVSKHYVLMSN